MKNEKAYGHLIGSSSRLRLFEFAFNLGSSRVDMVGTEAGEEDIVVDTMVDTMVDTTVEDFTHIGDLDGVFGDGLF